MVNKQAGRGDGPGALQPGHPTVLPDLESAMPTGGTTDPTSPDISFRPFAPADIGLMRVWLETPHVKRWWHDASTASEIAKLGHESPLPDGTESFVATVDGAPVGYVQAYRALAAPDGFWKGLDGVTAGTRGIDFLIGDPAWLNRKFGRHMLKAFCVRLFADPAVDRIVADPHPENWPAIIALKHVGFRDRGRVMRPGVNAMHLTLARAVFRW
jgi:RimJ/RimL family protein N-acetyltransferase